MSNGQGKQAIDELIAALDGLSVKINDACVESGKSVPSLLKMAFAATPFEIVTRAIANDITSAAANEAAGPAVEAKASRAKPGKGRSKRSKSLPQPMFEYVVLAQLNRRRGVVTQKTDLISGLPPKLNFGNDAAITTRLNKMRNDEESGYITWDKGKQQTAIIMMKEGEARLAELMGAGARALTPAAKQFLASKDAWFGEPL